MNFHILRDKFNSCIQVHGLSYIQHITNSQSDQFPLGLIAQLVEHCVGSAVAMGSDPLEAFFFGLKFAIALRLQLR